MLLVGDEERRQESDSALDRGNAALAAQQAAGAPHDLRVVLRIQGVFTAVCPKFSFLSSDCLSRRTLCGFVLFLFVSRLIAAYL